MAFRALLSSKNSETNTIMAAACKSAGIRPEVCSDIFSAIDKGKKQAFSCIIADWSDQPEASFLLKRARESVSNQNTVAIAIVDNEPTAAEVRDNHLDFLIYRPISATEAEEVLAKASEKMQPSCASDSAELSNEDQNSEASKVSQSAVSGGAYAEGNNYQPGHFPQAGAAHADSEGEIASGEGEEEPRGPKHALGAREMLAAVLLLTCAFCLWRSRDVIQYLSRTREGRINVLRESVAALFNLNQTGAMPVSSAGTDAQQDTYFSRGPSSTTAQPQSLAVVATESALPEAHAPLPKAPDLALPTPVFIHQEAPPVHVARAAIPESMKNSAPIERPIVVTVNPAQMMPVSAPQTQPIQQQFSEPVALSEDAARALLMHTVNPVYPPEALAQKLHGAVVLQALVGRDGIVEDVKIIRGYFLLGRAAIAAVKQWKFQPYNVGGHTASTQTVITINFSYPPG
jgi:TonB family protein